MAQKETPGKEKQPHIMTSRLREHALLRKRGGRPYVDAIFYFSVKIFKIDTRAQIFIVNSHINFLTSPAELQPNLRRNRRTGANYFCEYHGN